MKLETSVFRRPEGGYCTSVTYDPSKRSEILAIYDDKAMVEIDTTTVDQAAPTIQLGVHVTSISCSPCTTLVSNSNLSSSTCILAAVCSDGSLRLFHRDGTLEKKNPSAHSGAGICVAWNTDGSTIASSGEDGVINLWSRNAGLRGKLVSFSHPIYALAWGMLRNRRRNKFNEAIAVANGNKLSLIPIQNSSEAIQWEAFAKEKGVILSLDWNAVNGLILSGGEDCCYRVFDTSGICLYVSSSFKYVITCVSWQPQARAFIVGSYDMLCLCDPNGWAYEEDQIQTGSVVNIDWSSDGMQFCGSCADGSVIVSNLLGQTFYHGACIASIVGESRIEVTDEGKQEIQELDLLSDKVTHLAMTSIYLIVCTKLRCIIHNIPQWTTSSSVNLSIPVYGIASSEKLYALISSSELHIYSFQCRLISIVRCPGLRGNTLTPDMVSLSSDTLAVVEQGDVGIICLFDASTGKPFKGEMSKIQHNTSLSRVSLSQDNRGPAGRLLVFLDRNKDLYVASVSPSMSSFHMNGANNVIKAGTGIDSFAWGFTKNSRILATLSSSQYIFWYDVNGLFLDKDLALMARDTHHVLNQGKGSRILTFESSSIIIRQQDGSRERIGFPHTVSILHDLALNSKWVEATKFCGMVKSDPLWATYAGITLQKNQLDPLEVALCAIRDIVRVRYIRKIKSIKRIEHQTAELMLFKHYNPKTAVDVLLQANPPLVYRAIKVYINLHRWDDALELASKSSKNNDWYLVVLLWYRKIFLVRSGKSLEEENISDYQRHFKNYDKILEDEAYILGQKKIVKNQESEGIP